MTRKYNLYGVTLASAGDIFFRREYLILHLGCAHTMDSTSAKNVGKDVNTEFGKREELEFENKRFRTDPETSEEASQDTAVTETANKPGSSPDVSGINDCDPGYDLDYLELFADSTEFDEEFIINEVCEEIFESIVEMPSDTDEFEPVPCSSGLCSDKEYNAKCDSNSEDDCETDDRLHDRLHEHASSTQYIETVETLSLTLVTTRYYDGEILVSERRHHNFASSMHFYPEDIDWSNFLNTHKRK